MSAEDYARLDYILLNNPQLLSELVNDPEGVLRELGVDRSALECPEVAERALTKANAAAAAASLASRDKGVEALPLVRAAIAEHLTGDPLITKIPFGIQFAEPVIQRDLEITATGTVRCTFDRITCGGDVDG